LSVDSKWTKEMKMGWLCSRIDFENM